jgi:branched-chain amino acid transport system substrate-binding protein
MLSNKIQIDKKKLALVSYVGILSLLGILIFVVSTKGESSSSNHTSSQSRLISNKALQKRISLGDRILVTADNSPDKQAATKAFAKGDYVKAIELFNSSLQLHRNDPEAWIYANNATASLKGDTITIGAIVPIGSNLNVAKEILRGIAQAQYEINQKEGIGGKLIRVEIANDDNDPDIARQIAAEFVKNKEILAVIGHNSSDATIAAAPVYQEAGLVAISPTSVASDLSGIGNYIFRTVPSTRSIADTLAQYAVKSDRKSKIAICADSKDKASLSFKQEFMWSVVAAGGQVMATDCDFSAANFNPTEIPSQVVSDGADALLLIPSVNRIDRAIEVAQANQHRLAMFGSHTMYTFVTLQHGQVDINGTILAVPWHPSVNRDTTFLINAKQLWGGAGSWRTAQAYDATEVAIAGLKKGLKRDTLQKTLSNPGFSFKGATGDVRFIPSGDRQGSVVLVKIQPGKASGTGYDFVALPGKAEGEPSH